MAFDSENPSVETADNSFWPILREVFWGTTRDFTEGPIGTALFILSIPMVVEMAAEATRVLGSMPRLEQASTDSNIPISMGIPAITLGAGGTSGKSHTLDEWYDPRERDLGLKRALLVLLGMVGTRK